MIESRYVLTENKHVIINVPPDFMTILESQFDSSKSLDVQFKETLLPVLNTMYTKYHTVKKRTQRKSLLLNMIDEWIKTKKQKKKTQKMDDDDDDEKLIF